MSDELRVLSDRYRVDTIIGVGGMATVYKGFDLKLDRDVAIKILDKKLAEDNVFRTRFRMEAQSASRMSHTSIVRVFDAGEHNEEHGATVPYIVMELVSGKTLKQVISQGAVTVEDSLRYVDGILEALEYSHRAGVIHRDIKPGNVMITDDGSVKVMDFGIARAVSDSSSTVAETTQIIGTAAYFSPEQAKGDPVDARTDLYSTGVVLYELLAGRQPFRGETPVAVAYQHVSEAPTSLREITASIPIHLDAIVLRALAKDPYSRFPDASSFREALHNSVAGGVKSKRQLENLSNELYGANPRVASETARSLRQLTTDTTINRTQQSPPVTWIWAGVIVIVALVIAVLIWVLKLTGDTTAAEIIEVPVIPDVSQTTYERASGQLVEAGLIPNRMDEPDSNIPSGVVIRTDPAAGVNFTPGQKVTVVVSSGDETVTVPELLGKSYVDAQQALLDGGLTVGKVAPIQDINTQKNLVVSTSVESGTAVLKGTAIDLKYSIGTVTVVDYEYNTVELAEKQMKDLGLTVETEAKTDCDPARISVPETVFRQSAVGDVPVKTTVTLVYCAAP